MQNNDKQSLIIIAGPTAVGKTALSIELAKSINASIISADSMQVYKHMDIGSAKVTKDEMQGIKHYLIDVLEPEEEFNIATFKQFAKNDIEYIKNDGKIPIIAGGTGFYIQALLYDINFDDDANKSDEIRDRLENLITTKGNEFVHNMLKEVDEKAADEIHPNNVKRVIRALEYHYLTGEKISKHNETERIKESPYNFKYFVINEDRALLYKNIDKRVDIMIENGLVEETKNLLEKHGRIPNLVNTIGYREILGYIDNQCSLEQAAELLKKNTRNYAKRQLTWFRRNEEIKWDIYPEKLKK